jgi:hypothetical protein
VLAVALEAVNRLDLCSGALFAMIVGATSDTTEVT